MPRGLDTYVGRSITNVGEDSDGNWFVELDGGARIINQDGRRKKPDLPNNGTGLVFVMTIIEAEKTQMVFNEMLERPEEWRVVFNPLKYQIYDTDVQDLAWAPQAGGYGAFESGLPDEPIERIADGPTVDEEED